MTTNSVFCPNCGVSFDAELALWSHHSSFCSPGCRNVFEEKIKTCKEMISKKRGATLNLRIAELDPVTELDDLIHRLRNIKDIYIDRYFVPENIFRGPEGPGLDFPIATLDCDGERVFREIGIEAVTKALKSLTPTSAPTRKMKRPKWDNIKQKGGGLIERKSLD
jgi:hypothetical protein